MGVTYLSSCTVVVDLQLCLYLFPVTAAVIGENLQWPVIKEPLCESLPGGDVEWTDEAVAVQAPLTVVSSAVSPQVIVVARLRDLVDCNG